MPLSRHQPPSPRMSSSTPWSNSRTTKLSSRIAVSFAIARGRHLGARKVDDNFSSEIISRDAQPAGNENARHVVMLAIFASSRCGRRVPGSEIRISLFRKVRGRAKVFMKPGERKAGFLNVGFVMRRSRPPVPQEDRDPARRLRARLKQAAHGDARGRTGHRRNAIRRGVATSATGRARRAAASERRRPIVCGRAIYLLPFQPAAALSEPPP